MNTKEPIRKGFKTKVTPFVCKWKGRNLIKEIRNELEELRKLDPTYRKLIVKHLSSDEQ